MDYHELHIIYASRNENFDPEMQGEIDIAYLEDMGFESFEQSETELKAYIQNGDYETYKNDIEQFLEDSSSTHDSAIITQVEAKDWNAVWESNFEPITVGDCYIRAPFHPESGSKYEIVIMPKMSFGTGHHATTCLMAEGIMSADLTNKSVLDMGCGTGILAILALKCGAAKAHGIDIDTWAYENALENASRNEVDDRLRLSCGDASAIDDNYDFIAANINRNILLRDMEIYVKHLNGGGRLLISGFLAPDVDDLISCAEGLGLRCLNKYECDGWHALIMARD